MTHSQDFISALSAVSGLQMTSKSAFSFFWYEEFNDAMAMKSSQHLPEEPIMKTKGTLLATQWMVWELRLFVTEGGNTTTGHSRTPVNIPPELSPELGAWNYLCLWLQKLKAKNVTTVNLLTFPLSELVPRKCRLPGNRWYSQSWYCLLHL